VIGGVLRALGGLDLDLLGVFAALATVSAAWLQAKQHQTLATAYGVTARERTSIATELEALRDETWAAFVGEAEEANFA
jgi:SMODS and SLOG-associating 2TM effector domain 1